MIFLSLVGYQSEKKKLQLIPQVQNLNLVSLEVHKFKLPRLMNRDFNFRNTYNNTSYPTNIPPPSRQDYSSYQPQTKKQSQSELFIFNGEQPVQDLYGRQQKSHKPNLAFVPQRITKNPSQKAFPIIYNTYNDNGSIQPQIKLQSLSISNSKSVNNQLNQYDASNENNHSNLSDKEYHLAQYSHQQTYRANQLHTFQQIPHDSQPQTAKFLQIPDKMTSQHKFLSSQTEPYRPPPSQILFQQRQFVQAPFSVPSNSLPAPIPSIPYSRHERVVQRPIPTSPTSRVVIQEPQRVYPSFVEERSKLVQVPQQEYERYVEHLSHCRKTQEENVMCKTKIEQLGQKEQFYWQQNMTLREQNKRLRDLVTHFQIREKELLRQRQQQKQNFQDQIAKYRDSTLEQFRLLMERYKLQLQKNR